MTFFAKSSINMGSPLVSVILPVYNGELFLSSSIDSILSQTFRDFELLIIDDGSTDGSRLILEKYILFDMRVRVLFRENQGIANTLNQLIEMAKGTWIARMDQDDIALPHRFESQLNWLAGSGADICGSWIKRFGTWDKRVIRLRESDEAIKVEMLFCCPFAHPTVMIRADLFKSLRYSAEWDHAEDYDLWVQAAEAGWKMTNVPEVLLLYRIHPAQISTVSFNLQKKLTLEIQRRYWEYFFYLKGLNKEWIEDWFKTYTIRNSLPNMDVVGTVLKKILSSENPESQVATLSHVNRLYFRVAADFPDAATRWREFFPEWKWYKFFAIKLLFKIFYFLKIRPCHNRSYELFRKFIIFFISR